MSNLLISPMKITFSKNKKKTDFYLTDTLYKITQTVYFKVFRSTNFMYNTEQDGLPEEREWGGRW